MCYVDIPQLQVRVKSVGSLSKSASPASDAVRDANGKLASIPLPSMVSCTQTGQRQCQISLTCHMTYLRTHNARILPSLWCLPSDSLLRALAQREFG